jgi:nicotinamidase-related amidase
MMKFSRLDTAVVFIDPQNDVMSEKGANWAAVGASVTENRTVENMERIFVAARDKNYLVFISPHYFYPTDATWKFNGPLESDEFRTRTFARSGQLDLTRLHEFRRRLAGPFQALHRGRQDDRCQPAQGVRSTDQ